MQINTSKMFRHERECMEQWCETSGCGQMTFPAAPAVAVDMTPVEVAVTVCAQYVYEEASTLAEVRAAFVDAVQWGAHLVGERIILQCRVRRNTELAGLRGEEYDASGLVARIDAIGELVPWASDTWTAPTIRDLDDAERGLIVHYLEKSGHKSVKMAVTYDVLEHVAVCDFDVSLVAECIRQMCVPDIAAYTPSAMAERARVHAVLVRYESTYLTDTVRTASDIMQRSECLRDVLGVDVEHVYAGSDALRVFEEHVVPCVVKHGKAIHELPFVAYRADLLAMLSKII